MPRKGRKPTKFRNLSRNFDVNEPTLKAFKKLVIKPESMNDTFERLVVEASK